MQWTEDQEKAIVSKDGTVLVSAAAGSGKTAVLVERVLTRLEDAENGCNADELLIVTFTKAATAQMREKIATALSKRIAKDPGNSHLLRQQALLPFAQISTIDSFCSDIVRENFQKLGIEPDYKIAENKQLETMQEESAAEVAEEFYASENADFTELCELLFSGRDDRQIVATILELDKVASSYPDPDKWLRSLYENFGEYEDIKKSPFGALAVEVAQTILYECMRSVDTALKVFASDARVDEKYTPFMMKEKLALQNLLDETISEPWDTLVERANVGSKLLPSPMPQIRGCECFEKEFGKLVHDRNKKRLNEKFAQMFCTSEEMLREDMAYTMPLVRVLCEAVLRYREILMDKKMQANAYAFSDISYFASKCLVEENGEKTLYAMDLSERFCEILVDEFQDVNEAQYHLFQTISKNGENLFFVGDAKQSIYKFRQARPDIFIGLKKAYTLFEGNNYPSRIQLDANFRSRSGVTEWVNFAFRQLMSEPELPEKIPSRLDIQYDDAECLKAKAEYPESAVPDAQLHVVEYSKQDGERILSEGRYIAEWITKQMDEGLTVSDGNGGMRPAKYGDFCILIRSDNGRIAKIASVLSEYGIPAQAGSKNGFFDAPEIRFAISLLSVLDNPRQDVPLLSVMLSPVFGFTTDDLAQLRLEDRNAPLYALVYAKAETDARYAEFLKRISAFRTLATTLATGELVRRLSEETGYYSVVGAMSGGESRRANLRLLERFAMQYEQSGKLGLSGFMRFLDAVQEQGTKVESASVQAATADLVQIMTIHKSKGLEFPICILANCSGEFNTEEYKEKYILHPKYGVATIRRNPKTFAQYDTVAKNALNVKVKESNINEELRVLYVAMTRAKEKLVAVVMVEDVEKALPKYVFRCGSDGTVNGLFEMQSYADMLLSTAIRHPDAHILRKIIDIPGTEIMIDAPFELSVTVGKAPKTSEITAKEVPEAPVREDVLKKIREKTSYVYPFADLQSALSKRTASDMEHGTINRDFFASTIPAFMNAGGLTPAQRGTTLHRFMQYANYKAAGENAAAEADRLYREGKFTAEERKILPLDAVERFFQTDIGKCVAASDNVFREKRFTIEMSVCDLDPTLPESFRAEKTIIQGMVDCAFVENGKLYILDYKTDRDSPDVIRERYRTQLSIYKIAMEKCTDYPIGGVALYSFYNNCIIIMP